jgi:hypothetical protein
MDVNRPDTGIFVVKVWVDEVYPEGQGALWRGHITHVMSGKRRSVDNLGEITTFISEYLEEMGVEINKS